MDDLISRKALPNSICANCIQELGGGEHVPERCLSCQEIRNPREDETRRFLQILYGKTTVQVPINTVTGEASVGENELISRKTAIEAITPMYLRNAQSGNPSFEETVLVTAIKKLEFVPAVEAEPVRHGRWEDEYSGAFSNPRYRCSICKEKALYRHKQNSLGGWESTQALTDYCPNCGARMDA